MFDQYPEQLESLLCTNHRPDHHHLEIIHALRMNGLNKAAECTNCIERLKGVMHALEESRSFYFQDTNRYSALESPVRFLPTEVLLSIFSYYLSTDASTEAMSSLLRLSHVCPTWRRTLQNSPRLWTQLYIDCGQLSSEGVANGRKELVDFWMSMSNRLSVRVSISMFGVVSSPLVQTIVQYSDRFSELHLMLSHPFQLQNFGDCKYPHLTVLNIAASMPLRENTPLRSSAPVLNNQAPPLSFEVTFPVDFPWRQLTVLKLDNVIDANHWGPIFEQLTNLQHGTFSLKDFNWSWRPLPSLKVQTYPNLISLKLTAIYDNTGLIIKDLVFPNLERLYLRGGGFSLRNLPQLNEATFRSLTLLEVKYESDLEPIDLLFKFHSLDEFVIDHSIWALTVLFPSLSSKPEDFLPKLKTLTICMAFHQAVYDYILAALVQLVKSCQKSRKKLEEIVVYACPTAANNQEFSDKVKNSVGRLPLEETSGLVVKVELVESLREIRRILDSM